MLIEGQAVMDTVNTVVVMVHDTASDAQMEATREEIRKAGLVPVVIRGTSFQIAWSAGTPRVPVTKPTEPTETKHPDDVEILRREVRAWREWYREGSVRARDEVVASGMATDKSGALG